MVKYFVAYHAINKNGASVIGNIDVDMHHRVSQISDIRLIEKELAEQSGFKQVVITNFIKL